MQFIGSNERIFGINLNKFYIGVIKEIKLLRSSKTVNHIPIRLHNVLRENNSMNILLPVMGGEIENY